MPKRLPKTVKTKYLNKRYKPNTKQRAGEIGGGGKWNSYSLKSISKEKAPLRTLRKTIIFLSLHIVLKLILEPLQAFLIVFMSVS